MDFSDEIENKISQSSKQVHKHDVTFYNVDSLTTLAEASSRESLICSTCKNNMQKISELAEKYPTYLNNGRQGKKELEKEIDIITKHIKTHGYTFRDTYYTLYTLYGIGIGAILGILIGTTIGKTTTCILIFLCFGLLIGMIIGKTKDKNARKKGKQL